MRHVATFAPCLATPFAAFADPWPSWNPTATEAVTTGDPRAGMANGPEGQIGIIDGSHSRLPADAFRAGAHERISGAFDGPAREASLVPAQPRTPIPRRAIEGGSFLRAPSRRRRYRPAARQARKLDTGMGHIGFHRVRRHRRDSETTSSGSRQC